MIFSPNSYFPWCVSLHCFLLSPAGKNDRKTKNLGNEELLFLISTLKSTWKYVAGHYAGAVSWEKYRTLETILFTQVSPLSILMTPSDLYMSNRGISLTKSYDLKILVLFLIQDLTVEPRNWFGTYDSPALASWVLRLQLCTAIHD